MNYLWLLYISFYIVIISYYIVFLFYLLNLISRVYCSIFQNQTKFQNATVKIHNSHLQLFKYSIIIPILRKFSQRVHTDKWRNICTFQIPSAKKNSPSNPQLKLFFFALQFNFSVKRKWKQTGIFLQFIYLGIDHDHLMLYLNL